MSAFGPLHDAGLAVMRRWRPCLVVLLLLAGAACTGRNPSFQVRALPGDGGADRAQDTPALPPTSDAGDGAGDDVAMDAGPSPGGEADAETPDTPFEAPPVVPDAPWDVTPPPPPDAAPDVAMDLPRDMGGPAVDAAPDVPPDVPPDSTLSNGLVARYQLDPVAGATLPDVSGTRNATASGSVAWDPGFPQARFTNGGSLRFDGTTTYVTLPLSVLPQVAGERSISLWFWLAAPISDLRRTLISINNSTTVGIQLGLQYGVPAVWRWNSAPTSTSVKAPTASPAGWTHVVYTHRSGTHTIYVNGVRTTGIDNYAAMSDASQVILGAYEPDRGQEERWLGRIDDVRIYNRVLDMAEVASLQAGND